MEHKAEVCWNQPVCSRVGLKDILWFHSLLLMMFCMMQKSTEGKNISLLVKTFGLVKNSEAKSR
jgi:hypothetical protein